MIETENLQKESTYKEYLGNFSDYYPFTKDLTWDKQKLENPPVDLDINSLKFLLLSKENYSYNDVKECFNSDTNLLLATMSIISNRFNSRDKGRMKDSKLFTKNEEILMFTGYSLLRSLYSKDSDESLIPLIQSTRENIIHSNIRLVGKCLFRKYYFLTEPIISRYNFKNNDLIQEAFFTLMNACDNFSVENGTSFSSYTYTCLRNFLLNYYKDSKHTLPTTSLNTLESEIECPDCFERTMEKRILIKEMFESNSILKPKEKRILQLRHGLNQDTYEDGPTYTLREIAGACGVEYQWISEIQKMGEKKLRRELFKGPNLDIDLD